MRLDWNGTRLKKIYWKIIQEDTSRNNHRWKKKKRKEKIKDHKDHNSNEKKTIKDDTITNKND